jgi:flagellin
VTSLLNRAVTLATEASNGTLNSSQDTAANQEYQSILSEISNIGSTSTYNQQGVFGKPPTSTPVTPQARVRLSTLSTSGHFPRPTWATPAA